MTIETERTHHTTWRGQLTGAQLAEILREHLCDALGASRHGTRLIAAATPIPDESGLPIVAFALVHDHDWFVNLPPASDEAS